MGERKGERPGFERDRKKDRGGKKRETGIGRQRERERGERRERDRCGRERKRERDRIEERSRVVKIKNIEKQNLLYGCFKKQSTQKISNQKMKLKERDKSILEYVQCMYNNVHAYKVPGF